MSDHQNTTPAFPDARMKTQRKRQSIWSLALIGLIVCGSTGGLFGFYTATANPRSTSIGPAVLAVVLSVLVIASLAWSWRYWQSIDEMARRAHLDSWFWGGTLAATPFIIFCGVIATYPALKLDVIENLASSPTQAFGWGMIMLYSSMLLGYMLFWLIWWVRKR